MQGANRGWHWPREEQNANAYEGFGNLNGDAAAAARVLAAWAPVLRDHSVDDNPYRPEFDTTQGVRHG